ncbi:MAG: anaerobic sulfatase-maturation protein [Bacteroidales bacterium]|nr:anaerobic sulfatase-maturation protein [Bacteroidales bacterium]
MSTFQSIPLAFHVMAKPTGPICNLGCTYCYYLEKEKIYGQTSRFRMDDALLEKFINEYIATQNVPVIQFTWHGGEPTLSGMDYFRRVLYLQSKYSRGKTIENVLQTNGTLLNDEWCRFFADNHFLIGISVDGPEHVHDRYRLTRSGKPTFAQVMRGLELLVKHKVEFNTLSVVNDYNASFALEIYRFLKAAGSHYMQFTPIVERIAERRPESALHLLAGGDVAEGTLAPWSVKPMDYGKFLCAVFDEWVIGDVGDYFVPTFDSALANWTGVMPSICIHGETCGHAAAIEHNGDVYACDHYVFPEYRLGNIRTDSLVSMMYSPRQTAFGKAKRDALPQYCKECEFLFACNGECPKNRIARTPSNEEGLNYLCAGLRHFYRHISPYMAFMAEELANARPPANVMTWARKRIKPQPVVGTKQLPAEQKTAVRSNAPCPCGSGKKFKECCRNKPVDFAKR